MKSLFPLLLFVAVARAQLSQADPSVQQACRQAEAIGLPSDLAGLPVPKVYPVCDSYKLYDGKKFTEARACAAQERMALLAHVPGGPTAAQPSSGDEPVPAGGPVVLSELYANGEGVARDEALAGRFFCEGIETGEIEHDASETKHILAMLKRVQGSAAGAATIQFCDPGDPIKEMRDTPLTRKCEAAAADAHAEMHMAGIQSGIDGAQQDADEADRAVAPVLAKLTPAQRTAYRKLAEAMQRFIDAQAIEDILFMGGYGSGGLYPNELHAQFENQVASFAKGVPTVAPGEFAAADADLNAVYRRLVTAATPGGEWVGRPLNAGNLRAEQRAWLGYRDAFVAFGKLWKPEVRAEVWMLPLTRQRVDDLRQIDEVASADLQTQARERAALQQQLVDSAREQAANARAKVASYFDHQTAAQLAAWVRVQDAVRAFAGTHAKATAQEQPGFADLVRQGMYSELYAADCYRQHREVIDEGKLQAAEAANETKLNSSYKDAMGCAANGNVQGIQWLTTAGLREEQRAWLRTRSAWGRFYKQNCRLQMRGRQ